MKKIISMLSIVLLVALFFTVGNGHADTLMLGGNYANVNMIGTPNATEGGGSVDPSFLNGKSLNFVYCVDLYHNVSVPGTFINAGVTNDGTVNGFPVNNATQIAWLLHTYGVGGQGDAAKALQAAIWHVEYGPSIYLDAGTSAADVVTYYTNDLAALGSAIAGGTLGNYVGNFAWLTPDTISNDSQGLVGQVPEPSTMILLGVGVLGLALFGRRLMSKKV